MGQRVTAARNENDEFADAIPPSLTEDGFLGGRIKILQPEKGYRAGIDAVFLAATIPMEPGQTAFEAGCGVGTASLCLTARVPGIHVTGVEISPHYSTLAEENVRRNGFADDVRIIAGDVKGVARKGSTIRTAANSFDHAFANPPFFDDDKIARSPMAMRSVARGFGAGDLEIWVKAMASMAAPHGTVTIVHRADSLDRILAAFTVAKIGGIHVAPLFSREGRPALRVIVQGVKASRAPLRILRGLVLHDEGNSFTPAAEAILRDGKGHALL